MFTSSPFFNDSSASHTHAHSSIVDDDLFPGAEDCFNLKITSASFLNDRSSPHSHSSIVDDDLFPGAEDYFIKWLTSSSLFNDSRISHVHSPAHPSPVVNDDLFPASEHWNNLLITSIFLNDSGISHPIIDDDLLIAKPSESSKSPKHLI